MAAFFPVGTTAPYPKSAATPSPQRFHTSTCRQSHVVKASQRPSFIPEKVNNVIAKDAREFANTYERTPLEIPSLGVEVSTAFLRPSGPGASRDDRPPVCLLHGFDSSSLDFRRLKPLLSEKLSTWAVDLIGWGFSDYEIFRDDGRTELGPKQKREHLYNFWKTMIKRPMVLYGSSLGGAVAVDFALEHPEAVDSLVLQSAQGFIDGIGPMSVMPGFVTRIGVGLLKTDFLRRSATEMCYYDGKFASEDAVRLGSLHVDFPGWTEANMSFMRSGGYSLSERIKEIQQKTLIIWGRQDELLEPAYAERFNSEIQDSKLVWLDECGHAAFLEKAEEVADAVFDHVGLNENEN
ncbi:hypothetical protein BSKO_13012 [Bryopsis sp. KO-2023]|nr:hypothetical protein BSKO_13012 [Bryopsis sp. KO-2023]